MTKNRPDNIQKESAQEKEANPFAVLITMQENEAPPQVMDDTLRKKPVEAKPIEAKPIEAVSTETSEPRLLDQMANISPFGQKTSASEQPGQWTLEVDDSLQLTDLVNIFEDIASEKKPKKLLS